ncbi:DUF4110 domain-containing protein [Elizabethkingia ursingii]|uniref:DUF4110 domain-containing protein n=1 Tax=Elizabethkingia ursingii TaxID=1756150 RepID=UPI002012315C|nr:DUF4110 domain-containing protein [Elizabethkingia ursingii]MCL1666560.1 DUF4110 domain-containing protein [Elizabethkingia ursingii]
MIKIISKYWNVFIIIIILFVISYFVCFLATGGVNMDKGIGKLHYSKSLQEAKNEKTLIGKYFVYDVNRKQISEAWLEYARTYNNSDIKKIEKGKMLLSVKEVKAFEEIKDVYWEAFFRNKKLTALEDKGIINVIGVDKNMDTIILKPNKDSYYYIMAEK